MDEPTAVLRAIERVFRQERGQVLAMLIGMLGDFQLAEDALQDALVAALEHWPADGVPQRPGAWLAQVARRKAIDRLRRLSGRGRARLEPLDERIAAAQVDLDELDTIPDDRLKLIFTCCHPALPEEAQIALTLQALGGLTTAEIATAFLVPLPTMAQRLVRARRKIGDTAIPFDVPSSQRMAERTNVVLQVLYLIFTEGYNASTGAVPLRADLCAEAIRLNRVLLALARRAGALPAQQDAEACGLLALMLLHDARRTARIGGQGEVVLLEEQDRSLWDQRQIHEGLALLETTLGRRLPGPYQLQAAISALHVQAVSPAETDWPQIAALYERLAELQPTAIVFLNRAVAIGMAYGPQIALPILDWLVSEGTLRLHYPLYLARGEMQRRAGHEAAALASFATALELCQNAATRTAIMRRMASDSSV